LTCRQPGRDITKLARWLRCLFSLSLEHDEKVSLKCIEQVTHIAATQQSVSSPFPCSSDIILKSIQTFCPIITISDLDTPPPSSDPSKAGDAADSADDCIKELECYPKTELEWLASTVFNRAIDYYLQENDDATKRWADQAFIVAQWIDDGGATRDNLMARFANLKLGEQSAEQAG
jgi:hypothetical protein